MRTHYEVMGLDQRATPAEIMLRHQDLAEQTTPEIEEAFAVLSDPVLRDRYDRRRAEQAWNPENGRAQTELRRNTFRAIASHPVTIGTAGVVLMLGLIMGLVLGSGSAAFQLRNAGNNALQEGDLHTALIKHERAVAINGYDPDYLADLARTHHILGRHADAISTYTKALNIDPRHAPSLTGRAEALTGMGATNAAQEDIQEARRLGIPVP